MLNLQNLFRRNLPVKIVALISAIILWAYVMNEQNPSVNASFTIPVQIVNGPEGYNVDLSEHEVKIKVRAPRSAMAAVNEDSFKAQIDLSSCAEGESVVKIKTVLPQGFELLNISDESIRVVMESLIARGVPVEINTTGKAADGVTVGSVQPAQEYVNVYGPRHLVESIVKVSAQVPLSGNTADFTMHVKLVAMDSNGDKQESIAVLPGEMDVTVRLAQGLTTKIVSIKPVFEGSLPEGYTLDAVSVEPSQMEITGDETKLMERNSIETTPISLQNVVGKETREINLVIPDGVTVANKKVIIKLAVLKK